MRGQESIGRYLACIYKAGQCYVGRELAEYGIGSGQYFFLLVLSKKDGISQDALTEVARVDKATTGRAVKKLAEEGFIIRKRNPKDLRAYQIYLTEKGKRMLPVVREVLSRWNNSILKGLTEEEKQLALKLVKKIFDNLY